MPTPELNEEKLVKTPSAPDTPLTRKTATHVNSRSLNLRSPQPTYSLLKVRTFTASNSHGINADSELGTSNQLPVLDTAAKVAMDVRKYM